jgi:Zn-dependent peptidase ImmA (M78 family)
MSWSASFGDATKFKIGFEVIGDPDVPGRQTPYEASWGRFEIWVNGVNLCAHLEQGEAIEGVHWYLWPLFSWIAEQWDPLMHEEQMALRELTGTLHTADSGAVFLSTTVAPPTWYTGAEIDKWEATWHSWWARHCLLAARDGGLFPAATIRRYRDQIEISWDAETAVGGPEDFRFLNNGGVTRLDAEVVAAPLYEALRTFVARFSSAFGNQPDVVRLRNLTAGITSPEATSRRLPWLIGLGRSYISMKRRTTTLLRRVPRLAELVPAVSVAGGILTPSTRSVSLMYGSVSPDIDMADAVALGEIAVGHHRHAGQSLADELAREFEGLPISSQPWKSGYALADEIRERFVESPAEEALDLNNLVTRLGIQVEEARLHDPDVRGVALAGDEFEPVIVLSRSSGFNQSEGGRRFSVAHELCHLIVDRIRGGELGIVSGSWAPREIEQRANAFAAMLLMPIRGLESRVPSRGLTYEQLCAITTRFQTTPLATSWHLRNLGLISPGNFELLISRQA